MTVQTKNELYQHCDLQYLGDTKNSTGLREVYDDCAHEPLGCRRHAYFVGAGCRDSPCGPSICFVAMSPLFLASSSTATLIAAGTALRFGVSYPKHCYITSSFVLCQLPRTINKQHGTLGFRVSAFTATHRGRRSTGGLII